MTKAIPYLLVKNGKKAIEIYKELFDAELTEHQPFSKEVGKEFGMPDNFDYENSTMHAKLNINGAEVYLADNVMQRGTAPGIVEITLDLDSKEQLDKIYNKAKEKGYPILMELEKMFWGAWFARFQDPEGIGWQLNYTENQ